MTVSHLRFGPHPIHAPYLVDQAHFVGCHQPGFLQRLDVLEHLRPGGTFLLNTAYGPDRIWDHLPRPVQETLIAQRARFYVIDAYQVARASGMRRQINTVMQVCFFAISGVLPREDALVAIKASIKKTYSKKGNDVVAMNLDAVDQTLAHLHEVLLPTEATSREQVLPPIGLDAPPFVQMVLGPIIAGRGDSLPVSALPVDGTYPTGTAQWEKRNLAQEIPVWDPAICIQCGKCAMVCPHAVIRIKAYEPDALTGAPPTFQAVPARDREWQGLQYTIQVAPEDCTGCALCVDVCPVRNKTEARRKALNMADQPPLREQERANWDFFQTIPDLDRQRIKVTSIRQQQVQQPLFEFSGACSGCGETPYLKLLSQLFGDRLVVANATGCSSIYGGNLPTTPWTANAAGRGPAWANSLFEDNAEFGLGFRLSLDQQRQMAGVLLTGLAPAVGRDLADAILTAGQADEAAIHEQRERVAQLKDRLAALPGPEPLRLAALVDTLVRKSVWIVGGDGWAYDIGFGGLDHVLASGHNVKVLVLDTEVYSNTGGQASKATPRAAVAKFAAGGKRGRKKDLGLIAMSYGNIYVASVALGAKDEHTLKVFLEAEAYDGPALIIAYSHCIAHGIDMTAGLQHQRAAVESGQWLLYRYNPDRVARGENPLVLESKAPRIPLAQYFDMGNRFKILTHTQPEVARQLLAAAQADVDERWHLYQYLAARSFTAPDAPPALPAPDQARTGTAVRTV